jgi:rhamnogalacturonan hydrolase
MLKTFPGGRGAVGYVTDSVFENFWSYDSIYGLDIDQYWEQHTSGDTGAVKLSNLVFRNWTGTVDNGVTRGVAMLRASNVVPATNIQLIDFKMWTKTGNKVVNVCKNVYGSGFCAKKGSGGKYATSAVSNSPPAGYTAPVKPRWALPDTGYGTAEAIPVVTPAPMWKAGTKH